jgi:hypothetical protein
MSGLQLHLNALNAQAIQSIFTSPLPIPGDLAESVIYDEDDDESDYDDDDEEEDEEVALCDMTDTQIDEYIESLGREPRKEFDEWTIDYTGGPILRYSYVNFSDNCLANQRVSNITIRGAVFTGSTLRNYVFEDVEFYDCNFINTTMDNVTFNKSVFINCELHPNTLQGCHVESTTIESYEEDEHF